MQFTTILSAIAIFGAAIAAPVAEAAPVAVAEAEAEPALNLGVGGFLFTCPAGTQHKICCPTGQGRNSRVCGGANPFLTGLTCPLPQTNAQAIAWCCKSQNAKTGVFKGCHRPAVISL